MDTKPSIENQERFYNKRWQEFNFAHHRKLLRCAAILSALAERGLRRILIEGGAHTVSRFIAAGCLDRLHVMVAPIMFGSGQTGVTLAPIATADEALRSPMRAHLIGDEVLLDCDLSAQRVVIGCAKKST